MPRYGQGIGILRGTSSSLATRNCHGIIGNRRFRLALIFRILSYTPTPIQLRVVSSNVCTATTSPSLTRL